MIKQQKSPNLIWGLFGSVLIHGSLAFTLFRQQSEPSLRVNKPIEIVVIEPSAVVDKSNSTPQAEAKPQPALPSPKSTPQPKTPPKTIAPPVNQPATNPTSVATTAQPPAPVASQPTIAKPPQNLATPPTDTKDPEIDPSKPPEQLVEPADKPESNIPQPDSSKPEPISAPKPTVDKTVNPQVVPSDRSNSLNQPQAIPPPQKPADANSVTPSQPIGDRQTESSLEPKLPKQPAKPTATAANPLKLPEALGDRSSEITAQTSSTANLTTEDSHNSSNNSPPEKPNNSHNQEQNSVAANTTSPEPPKPLSVSCEKNCQPEYPDILEGEEGSAGIQITIDKSGKVINAVIALPHGNSQLNQEALQAAQSMEFSSIDRDLATIRINISFTVAGSDFEKKARQEQQEQEK